MHKQTVQIAISRLLLAGIATADTVRGCNKAEISDLEKQFRLKLPPIYRTFLTACGREAGTFLTGTDWAFEKLPCLKDAAFKLLNEHGMQEILLNKHFVFAMHQGYQFLCFECGSCDDPPVFIFIEGEKSLRQVFASFSEWLLQCVDDEIAVEAELSRLARERREKGNAVRHDD